MRKLASERGAALPLVMWAVFVLTTTAIVVISMVDFDIELESTASKRFAARQAALTGLAYGSHPQIKRGDEILNQTLPDGTRIEVLISSEDARLNINETLKKGRYPDLIALFRHWGVEEQEAMAAVDCLKDWIDPDEFRSLNGAEAADLDGEGDFSLPENRPFLHISEMQKVKGMHIVAQAKPDWMDFFSVKSSNRLDLRDASVDFLEVFGKLNSDQAQSVLKFRNGADEIPGNNDDPEIKTSEDLAVVVPLSDPQRKAFQQNFGKGSSLRRIVSKGIAGDVQHEISVVTKEGGSDYLEWSEK